MYCPFLLRFCSSPVSFIPRLPSGTSNAPPKVIKPNGVGIYSPTVAEQSKIGIFVPAGTEAQVVMDTLNPESGADPHICLVNMAGETIACDDQPATAVRSVVKFLANVTDFYRVIVSSKAGNPEVQVYMNYTGATPAVDADTGTFYNASGYQNSMFFMPGLVRATVTVTTSTSDANAVAVSMNQYDNDNLWPQPLHPSSNVSVAIGNDTVTKTFIVSAMPGARFDVTTYRDPTLSVVHASVTLRDVAWATIDWMDQAQFYLRNREKGYAKLARTTYDRHVQLYTYMVRSPASHMPACRNTFVFLSGISVRRVRLLACLPTLTPSYRLSPFLSTPPYPAVSEHDYG